MTTKPSDLIRRGWCQGQYAMNANGDPVMAAEPSAVRWCLAGAINAVMAVERQNCCVPTASSIDARQSVRDHLKVKFLSEWNDAEGRTKDEVIAALEAVGL